jgi:hypothetical protein
MLQQADAPPDALLLDVRLLKQAPELIGLWMTQPHLHNCPLIAIALVGAVGESRSLPAAAYLLRPIKQRQLQQTLMRVFWPADATPADPLTPSDEIGGVGAAPCPD